MLGIGVFAQTQTVKGVVTSSEDGLPVIGASVFVSGTSNGTITDDNGNFTLTDVPANAFIIVAYMAMQSKTLPASAQMSVVLDPDNEVLNEVVITAMGISREKKALGYAVQDVKSEELLQGAATSLGSAISGKVSGVSVTASSGMPGASQHIVIRGARSFDGDNTPLYVVDGMPVTSTSFYDTGNSVTGADYADRALDIDPNDIESVNILKGQAASALYGMRASNGVIVITTKSGAGLQKGRPHISVSSNVAVTTVSTLPAYQTEFAQGNGGRFSNMTSLVWGPKISDLADDARFGGNTDNSYTAAFGKHPGQYYVPQLADAGLDPWATPQAYNNMNSFFKTGVEWSNNVNVAQAFDKGSYSFSLGSTTSSGIVPNTGMERYNARLAATAKLSKLFTTGFNGSFVASNVNKQTGGNDGLVNGVYASPASYNLAGIPYCLPDDPYTQIHFRNLTFDNPYWAVNNNNFNEKTQRFYGNAYLSFDMPFNNGKMKVSAKYQLGIDAFTNNNRDVFGYGHRGEKGEISAYGVTSNELNSLFTASFDWNINSELHFNILYGNEIVNSHNNQYSEYGNGFNFPGWNHMNNAVASYAYEYASNRRTFGNFLNAALDWKDMLFLNVTGRQDTVSSMPANSRTFWYPSVSLGFIFTELEALKNPVLTFGKLRASYSQVGMAGTYRADYYSVPTYGGGFSSGTPFSYPYNDITAYTPSTTVYNSQLVPQNTVSYEGGIDLGFWNGVLTFNYTFSRQNVKDQIFAVPLAGSTGSDSFMTNAGSIHTNAHEFTIGAQPFNKRNFKWDMALNFTKVDNYVDKLADGVESIFLGGFVEPQVRAGIGDKFPVIYGVSYLRNENGDIVVDEYGYPQVGEEKVIGSVSPDFQVGFNTTFEIYKLKIAATFDWKQGGSMYCGTAAMMDYYGTSQKSADYRKMDSFLFELPAVKEVVDANGNVTYAPNDILIPGDEAYDYFTVLSDISEYFVRKTSYLKLRECSISYPFQIGKTTLAATAFARNIILWSALKGFDPEASQGNTNMAGGFERFSLPGASTFGFGLTFKF